MNENIRPTKEIAIDGNLISSKEEFYYSLRTQLGGEFPLASNLDALHDVLTSISFSTSIVLTNQVRLSQVLGDYWDDIYRVIMDSLDENYNLGIMIAD